MSWGLQALSSINYHLGSGHTDFDLPYSNSFKGFKQKIRLAFMPDRSLYFTSFVSPQAISHAEQIC